MLMIAGPNGAGKTTFTRYLASRRVALGDYINPDDIAATLEGSYDARVRQAQRIAEMRRSANLDRGISFTFETVMSHESKVELLSSARALGFQTLVYFVGTDAPELNVERVALRVARGGHDVPEDRIVARWHRTMNLLYQAMTLSDRTFLFDNSGKGDSPRLVASWRRADGFTARHPLPSWVRTYVVDRL